MTENSENPFGISTSADSDLAVSCQIGLNDSGTCEKIDARLTQRRSPTVRGYVYFIRAGKFIKIGFSTRPMERLAALQTSHPGKLEILGTRQASRDFEGELHAHFASLRARGEWFRAEEPLLDYIEEYTPEGIEAANARRQYELDNLPIDRTPPLSEEAKAMIGRLINAREAHGADTPAGHAFSNLVEQIKNMAGYVRPAWATHESQTLPYLMNHQMKRIEAIRAAAN